MTCTRAKKARLTLKLFLCALRLEAVCIFVLSPFHTFAHLLVSAGLTSDISIRLYVLSEPFAEDSMAGLFHNIPGMCRTKATSKTRKHLGAILDRPCDLSQVVLGMLCTVSGHVWLIFFLTNTICMVLRLVLY